MDWRYLFLSFDGRVARQPFWIAFAVVLAAELGCHLAVSGFAQGERISSIVSLAFAYPELALFAKRGYDRGMPLWVIGAFFGLSTLMDFFVVIGLGGGRSEPSTLLSLLGLPWIAFTLVLLVELGLRRGTIGPNQYGPDPLAGA